MKSSTGEWLHIWSCKQKEESKRAGPRPVEKYRVKQKGRMAGKPKALVSVAAPTHKKTASSGSSNWRSARA